jgi:RNA recognition motif-containing protein
MSQETSGKSHDGPKALSHSLSSFRRWLTTDANCSIHPSLCIVNGEATDGTKNAPVLVYGPPSTSKARAEKDGASADVTDGNGTASNIQSRCGNIDMVEDQCLWDRSIGCQVRCVREVKKEEVLMEIPQSSTICPSVVAASDSGRAVFGCIEGIASLSAANNNNSATVDPLEYWEYLAGTADVVQQQLMKAKAQSGTQLLVNILRERKRAEDNLCKAQKVTLSTKETTRFSTEYVKAGTISSRAPLMLFLLQQRFGGPDSFVTSDGNSGRLPASPPPPSKMPASFAPWIRTLPSSFSLPLCWKRNELALLSSCIGGLPLLQEVAAHTHILSNDLIQLLKGGLLESIAGDVGDNQMFPPEQLTWDSWVWAAAAQMSRAFPVDCFLREDQTLSSLLGELSISRSPLNHAVWEDLGVLIPFMDMLNHEPTSCQIRWERAPSQELNALPRFVSQKRIKKGAQIFSDYGSSKSNHDLIVQYGFAQVSNPADGINIAWGLGEGVGGLASDPAGYEWIYDTKTDNKCSQKERIFESTDVSEINDWWTEMRLKLLKIVTGVDDEFIKKLSSGKKLSATACVDSPHHPVLLSSAVVCTMSKNELKKHFERINDGDGTISANDVPLTKRHQRVLLQYMIYFYNRKMEKLLSNLNEGFIKAHYPNYSLWLSGSQGGLYYAGDGNVAKSGTPIGWQSFFDSHAYNGTVEVEKHYYAMAPDSCVLALYDGNLRAIQSRLDELRQSIAKDGALKGKLAEELQHLSFNVLETDEVFECEARDGTNVDKESSTPNESNADSRTNGRHSNKPTLESEEPHGSKVKPDKDKKDDNKADSSESHGKDATSTDGPGRNRKKSRLKSSNAIKSGGPNNPAGSNQTSDNKEVSSGIKTTSRPAAIKLHIGNLSYATRPEDLFQFFSSTLGFGPANVLECHIPTERETGKSRGFGFVTMPEDVATRALAMTTGTGQGGAEKTYELHGRLIKVAKSNTAGSNRGAGIQGAVVAGAREGGRGTPNQQQGNPSSTRCSKCGYRPKYCTCPTPQTPGAVGGAGIIPPPPPGPPPQPGTMMPFGMPAQVALGMPPGVPGPYGLPTVGLSDLHGAHFGGSMNRGGGPPEMFCDGAGPWGGGAPPGVGGRVPVPRVVANGPSVLDPRGGRGEGLQNSGNHHRDRGGDRSQSSSSRGNRDSRRHGRSRSYSRDRHRDRRSSKRGKRRSDISPSGSDDGGIGRHHRKRSSRRRDEYRERGRRGYRDQSPSASDTEGGGRRRGSCRRGSKQRRRDRRESLEQTGAANGGGAATGSGGSNASAGESGRRSSRRRKRSARANSKSRSSSRSRSLSRVRDHRSSGSHRGVAAAGAAIVAQERGRDPNSKKNGRDWR